MKLKGKKVLITGGNRGIGKAIAMAYAKEGADIAITGRNPQTVDSAVSELRAFNARAEGIVVDIRNVKEIDKAINEVAEKMGGLDILVNNAGVFILEKFLSFTEETWDQTIDTNLKGLFFASQSAANYMIKNGIKGRIINVCSEVAFRGTIDAYGASKWAVRGLTQGWAKNLLPHGILVNAIAPGPTATDMLLNDVIGYKTEISTPFARMAYPEEIADLAVFLASDESSRITGEIILINGGLF